MNIEQYRIEIKKKALGVPWESLVEFNCEHCGKLVTMRSANVRKKERLLCNPCQISYSKSLRTPEQKAETHKKTVETCLKRYNTVNGGCSEQAKQKARDTWKKNWGSEENCFKKRTEKAHSTFLEKYNGSYSTPEINEKKVKTMIANSGSVENSYRERTEKAVATNRSHHDGVHNFINADWLERRKEVMLEKYGVEYITQSRAYQEYINKKYEDIGFPNSSWIYDNKRFDSFWEIAFYICLVEHGVDFKFHPATKLYYYNSILGREAQYKPDFLIGDRFIEIKGDHFFNKEGYPIDCRGNDWSDKLKFMEQLNVTLIIEGLVVPQTTLEVLDISPYILEALELKGHPSKYAFIESCRSIKNKNKGKTKVLYEIENQIMQP